MQKQVYSNRLPNRTPITTAADRVQRLQKLHDDLVGRDGDQHPLARRVARHLGYARATARIGEGVGQ